MQSTKRFCCSPHRIYIYQNRKLAFVRISKQPSQSFCRLFFVGYFFSVHNISFGDLGELVNLQSTTLFPRSRLGDENMSESGHKHNQQKDRKGKLITANHKESLWACVSATIRTAKRTSTSSLAASAQSAGKVTPTKRWQYQLVGSCVLSSHLQCI